ncbi:3-hydroxyacyl-CoA dehydrogenase family protein [Daejeonella sp.]|uniref:3-hydroxyacyl-CoA dehydrogenase family protein n=1 Tax=Daejeonella sp. TaxID=2805397 RepID=UPI003C7541A8
MFMNYISVIGSGTMGNGIAHTFALSGFKVNIIDLSQDRITEAINTISKNLDRQLQKGTITSSQHTEAIGNIQGFTLLEAGVKDADLVIEAATENVDIKLKIFADLDKLCKPTAILASNTSSISITKIAAVTARPELVIGMHFMNPVPVMKLVEVIRGFNTSDKTTNQIMDLSVKIGKVPVEVNDYPGFVANRILMPMINEAIQCLNEGVAGVTEIDTVMKLGMSHPMGPLQLADFIGLDVCLAILNVLHQGFGNPKYAPSPLLVNMVASGQLGVKSGSGFYDYSAGIKEAVLSKKFKK